MRKVMFAVAALGALVWSSAVWAVVDTTVTITNKQGEPLRNATISAQRLDKKKAPELKTQTTDTSGKRTAQTNDKGEVILTHEEKDKDDDAPFIITARTKEGTTLRTRTTLREALTSGKVALTEPPARTPEQPSMTQPRRTPTAPRTATPPQVVSSVPVLNSWIPYAGLSLLVNQAKHRFTERWAMTGEETFSATDKELGVGVGLSFTNYTPAATGSALYPFLSFDAPMQDIKHQFGHGTYIGEQIKFMATLGVLFNYPITPEFQVYGLGGVSLADKKFIYNFGEPDFYSREIKWVWGGMVGGGVAMAIPGWRGGYAFVQYEFRKFQDADIDRPSAVPDSNFTHENDMHMVRVGVAARTDWLIPMASDRRLKRDIEAVGRLDSGLSLYRYRYLWSDTEYVGVMAQEVAEILPEAVRRGADGFLRVDYEKLGTRLMTWEEWNSRQALAHASVLDGAE
jgi:endosialidase-like protein